MEDDKNFFRDLRKKLLADLFVKQCKELKQLYNLYFQGLLKDTTELYKVLNKVKETKKQLKELTGSEPSETAPVSE